MTLFVYSLSLQLIASACSLRPVCLAAFLLLVYCLSLPHLLPVILFLKCEVYIMFSVIFYNARKGEEVRLDTSFTDHRWNIPSPVFKESGGHLSMITDCGFFAACQRLIDQGFKKVITCDRDQHYGNGRNLPN